MYLLGLFVITAAVLVLTNIRWIRMRRDYVRPDTPALHYSAVQIICGDCAGEGISPVKTFMDRNGRCSRCRGASYVLASDRGLFMRSAIVTNGLHAPTDESGHGPAAERTPRLTSVPDMPIAV